MTIRVNPQQTKHFTLYVRIPGWARNQPAPSNLYQYKNQNLQTTQLDVNGTALPLDIRKGYVAINRSWQTGDQVHVSFPMAVRQVLAHPSIQADENRATIERGPIVYCAEWPDFNAGKVTHLWAGLDYKKKTAYN